MSRKFKEMLTPANTNELFMRTFFFRNRVIAMAAPGITAHNALRCKPTAIYKAMLLQRLYSIVRTSGGVAAYAGGNRGYNYLIKPYQEDKWGCCQLF